MSAITYYDMSLMNLKTEKEEEMHMYSDVLALKE